MRVLLTGATGYIGSAVLQALTKAGHDVVAPVRSGDAARRAEALGASALVGGVTDGEWLDDLLAGADAAVHAASPGDETSADFDTAVVGAVIDAFSGTAKPYLHTSGVWIWGDGRNLDEDGPLFAADIVAWRPTLEQKLLDSDVRVTLPAPGIVYGGRRGLTELLRPDEKGVSRLVGSGSQHWTTVHVDDLAELYVLLLERGDALGYVLGVSGENPTVEEIARAFANGATVHAETEGASRSRLGAALADALLMDQQATGAKARALGWVPRRPSVVDVGEG